MGLWSRAEAIASAMRRVLEDQRWSPVQLAGCKRRRVTAVRVFILYANPVATSFGAALHTQVVATLRARGHEIDDCDLHRECFDPVMSEREWIEYHDTTTAKPRVALFADRLLAADALVLVYPVWNERFPAILKGFFDRVFIPGVSF
jgi:NAD(P)H dehydrogenase (quinone)